MAVNNFNSVRFVCPIVLWIFSYEVIDSVSGAKFRVRDRRLMRSCYVYFMQTFPDVKPKINSMNKQVYLMTAYDKILMKVWNINKVFGKYNNSDILFYHSELYFRCRRPEFSFLDLLIINYIFLSLFFLKHGLTYKWLKRRFCF